ncbi:MULTISPECIES: molybdopterin-binding protein [Rhodomicrobium]|uniref:competence/damage-inducible protein A n=1 Tax=Rhodomicrobium TaxID=1068 RepID=UPI000B4C051A|nr:MULTISPECIES: molybdopterin-binding protein [Rhodomicrobium]
MTETPETTATQPEIVTAAILVIGDEILSGRTKDKNIGTIADHLTAIGIRLREVRVVADEEADIIAALDALRGRYDYVFTTGGIGPTHDDITADAVAKAFGVSIDVDPRARAMLRERLSEADLTPARLRMARIPAGAELVDNPVSRAPGFFIGNVIVMAGVPRIMEAMLASVTPRLRTGAKLLSLSLHVDAPEGTIAPHLSAAQDDNRDVQMGSYPYFENGRPAVYLVLRATDPARLEQAAQALEARLTGGGLPHERRAPDAT